MSIFFSLGPSGEQQGWKPQCLRSGIRGDAMVSPPELLFAFLPGFPPSAAPASSALLLLLPKCLHRFPRSAVFL